MGAKYLPTKKDLKASKRFQNNQSTQSKFIASTAKPAPAPKPAAPKKYAQPPPTAFRSSGLRPLAPRPSPP